MGLEISNQVFRKNLIMLRLYQIMSHDSGHHTLLILLKDTKASDTQTWMV